MALSHSIEEMVEALRKASEPRDAFDDQNRVSAGRLEAVVDIIALAAGAIDLGRGATAKELAEVHASTLLTRPEQARDYVSGYEEAWDAVFNMLDGENRNVRGGI